MILLWLGLALMTLLGLFVILVPMLKHRARKELTSTTLNALVFRDRLHELDQDLAEQKITAEQYDQLKQELELNLLSDTEVEEAALDTQQSAGGKLALLLALLIPLVAGVIYLQHGQANKAAELRQQEIQVKALMPEVLAGNFSVLEQQKVRMDTFIRGLQRYLQTNPEQAKVWYLLGVAYLQMGMAAQGDVAFQRALRLEPNNTDFTLGAMQASIRLNNGRLAPEMAQLLADLMRREPNNPKPYMTLGLAFYQSNNPRGAIDVWSRYLRTQNPDPQAVTLLENSIAAARQALANSANPSDSGVEAEGALKETADVQPRVVVTVDISPQAKSQLAANAVLFVFAKAVQGPPMPLAVVRQPVTSWPIRVSLSDREAMTPQFTISNCEQVQVQARISNSGQAVASSGDWQSEPQNVTLGETPVSVGLTIGEQVP